MGLVEIVHFSIHMLKKVYIFKSFVVRCIRALSWDEREAFRHWCIGIIPKTKLEMNLSDGDMFNLIELLCNFDALSFTDLVLLKRFLSSVSRYDMLKELERAELGIQVGSIMEDYIKSVYGLRQGAVMKLISRYKNIVEFLVATREENQELISLNTPREVNDKDVILEDLDRAMVSLDSQLSWSTVISSLVIMGELYASFSQVRGLEENGYYVNMFSETRAFECLTQWMLNNGGLVSKSVELTSCSDASCNITN